MVLDTPFQSRDVGGNAVSVESRVLGHGVQACYDKGSVPVKCMTHSETFFNFA